MLGGENVYIAGPCFHRLNKIVCSFGGKNKVSGSYMDEVKAKCVAPMVSETGRVQLKVSLDGGKTFPFQGFFYYGEPKFKAIKLHKTICKDSFSIEWFECFPPAVTVIRKKPIVRRSPQVHWVKGKNVGITWDTKKLGDKARRVNIDMANYKVKNGEIQLDGFVSISTQNNTGTSTISLPSEGADDMYVCPYYTQPQLTKFEFLIKSLLTSCLILQVKGQ